MNTSSHENPFKVFSPEHLDPGSVIDLFVVDSPGVDSIQSDGHAMLVGARGAGKSMLLRYLEPDCQQRLLERNLRASSQFIGMENIYYYTAYLTVRETELSLQSLHLIEGTHAAIPVNESLLVLTISLNIASRALKNGHFSNSQVDVKADLLQSIIDLANRHGCEDFNFDATTEESVIRRVIRFLSKEYQEIVDFLDCIQPDTEFPPYRQRLFRYSGFLVPFIAILKSFPSMPSSKRFFLAIDDADKLSETQTKILNTWLARRNNDFSLKVAYEMYGYKTFYTTNQARIEAPHDYQEIRISDVYTSNRKTKFRDRMHKIVNRRISMSGIEVEGKPVDAYDFFPEDRKQKIEIDRIADTYRKSNANTRSSRARDDAYRYAVPDFISGLAGIKKNRSTYRYAGFSQLVDISSGVPRYFLDAAQKMYDRQIVKNQSYRKSVMEIDSDVQDSVVRDQATELLMDELEKLRLDTKRGGTADPALMLNNLISCLGTLFETILLDQRNAERRVFSFAVSDHADEIVQEVLRLGLRCAYFSRSSIGRKEGFGRTERYVLSRRFAPNWNLDPSGFSAYKFLKNDELKLMMINPEQYRLQLRRQKNNAQPNNNQYEISFDDDEA